MRSTHWLRLLAILGALALASCSYIGNMFPDKQKQYRYSNELPDLEIPPDLDSPYEAKESSMASRGMIRAEERDNEDEDETGKDAGKGKTASADTAAKPSAAKRKSSRQKSASVTLAESSDNSALIEMDQPFAESWNDVSRALGRMKIEVSDQNRTDGVFYVYYGGDKPKKQEETSFFDDVASMFKGERDQSQEFQIKLEDKEQFTFIKIQDQEGQTVSEGPGLELLKTLHKKLLTLDQPENDREDDKPPEAESKR